MTAEPTLTDATSHAAGVDPATPAIPVVTGIGLALPGVAGPADLLRAAPPAAPEPVDPAARLGRRGLRYKDRATQLALCAAQAALGDSGLLGDDGRATDGGSVGVVASSNLGNADTVCTVAATIAAETVTGTSPMDLPNASSNVVASCVAIRFGLRGANLMACNGATSGLDAVFWAATLVASRRVPRVVAIGVEPRTEVVRRLCDAEPAELFDGAVALVVEAADAAARRSAGIGARLGHYTRSTDLERVTGPLLGAAPGPPGVWFVPERYAGPPASGLDGVPRHDVSAAYGRGSGAHGVLQCAAAATWLGAGNAGPALVTTGVAGGDEVAGMLLSAGVP